jgi:hypothetical protein
MRWHAIERADAAVTERSADPVDLIRVSIKRAAHHQEDTCRPQALYPRGYRLGRRLAKYDLILALGDGLTLASCPLRGWTRKQGPDRG